MNKQLVGASTLAVTVEQASAHAQTHAPKTLYVLQAHGEQTFDSLDLTSAVHNENFVVQSLSILMSPVETKGTDVLLLLAPETEFTLQDTGKVLAYLAREGRADLKVFGPNEFKETIELDAQGRRFVQRG